MSLIKRGGPRRVVYPQAAAPQQAAVHLPALNDGLRRPPGRQDERAGEGIRNKINIIYVNKM